jgi:site-specific recombinase XerD
VPDFGLRRVQGTGDHEAALPLPQVARTALSEYLATERRRARPSDPLFVVRFKMKAGAWREERMRDHRVFKVVKALGQDSGLPELHPHAFRHSWGVELLRRTRGNLRAVQEHLRHQDIQTTTIYTRLTQPELQQIVRVFRRQREGVLIPSIGTKTSGGNRLRDQGGDPGGIRTLMEPSGVGPS